MSETEDKRRDVNAGSTTSVRHDARQDRIEDPAKHVPSETPAGFDRRRFIMRSATISAAAVLTGCTRSETERTAPAPTPAAAAAPAASAPPLAPDLNVVKKGAGAGDDGGGRVLQGGAGPLELAHDRADAHYLRLLSAVHEASGGDTREGDGAQGAPVRQPERDRPRARHGARCARGAARTGTGHRRSLVPRQDARRTQSVLPVEARRQDVQSDAQGHRLRRDQRRVSSPQHHDGQADGRRHRALRAGVLLGRRRIHRVEGLRGRPRRTRRSTRSGRWGNCESTPRTTSYRSRK